MKNFKYQKGSSLVIMRTFAIVLVATLVLMGTAMGEITRTGLVGEWHFDGDAKDSSGNGKDGTINGATFVDGKFSKALSFDGIDDNVSLGKWFNYQTFTISMWVNANPSQGQYADILDNRHHYNINWVMQQDNFSVNQYYWGTGDGPSGITFNLYANQWTHLVVTRNAGTGENGMYINGVFLSSSKGTLGINYDEDRSFSLGSHFENVRYWGGKIDELMIYNRDLSGEEVKAIYEAGQITITSTVSGAEVLVDGSPMGTASPSLTIRGVAPGNHIVKCRLSGYSDFDTNIALTAGSIASVNCALNPAPKPTTPTPTTPTPTTPTPITPAPPNPGTQPGTPPPTSSPTLPAVKSVSITGKIIDAKTGEPAKDANVNIDGKSATTDANGEYDLTVEVGKHSLSVSKDGYETLTRSIIVPEGGSMLDLTLKPDSGDSTWLWIVLILIIVVVAAGMIYLLYRKKKLKEQEEKEKKEKEEKEKQEREKKEEIERKEKEKREKEIKEREERERKAKEKKSLCMFCHAPLIAGSKFCNECGKKQEEKTRFCMNCGTSMPHAPDLCSKCNKMPPSDVDTKTCKNCSEVIPSVAKFCGNCGARQPE